MEQVKNMIDNIISGDNLGAESDFKDVMMQKVGDAMERKRIDVAKSLVTGHVPEFDEDDAV